ncbi:hypothetical protein Z517_12224 [Fonsecaea pedrosoi CBS 271.37]|uniref:Clr5 domain-containing protein n=1 Tax=Fonsecaea pedrosoi CBS 271.37 TaxID=1442368 RepID=A0A0D2GPE0_9EURO|nr:uncharacterized protein Z517_12224 [Fonsecaea pedrosoi CBS 271.37]KIW74284.1 hypothetical protein Z517_12224 [Fonsecaea pedrosoi CBS 271.37]
MADPSRPVTAAANARATVPQTPQEWLAHRAIITHLYRDRELPLKEVQRIMEREYRFKATKRMYNTRFNQWNIRKNYRAEEKDLLAARIAQAHLQNRPASQITFDGRPVKLHRVLRHLRDPKRGVEPVRARPKQKVHRTRFEDDDDEQQDSLTSSSSSGGDDMVRVPVRPSEVSSATPAGSGNTTSLSLTPSSSQSDHARHSDDLAVGTLTPTPTPSPPIFPPKNQFNAELILQQTRTYYLKVMDPSTAESVPIDNNGHATAFWSNVKSGIYFLKKQCPDLAWPLLNQACALVGDDMFTTSQLFLNSVFTVLSPVNTRVYPQVRSTLLRYLAGMAAIKLQSPQHPLAVICREMAREDNQLGGAAAVSEAASHLTLEVLTQTLGRHHHTTFAVHRSLVSLLRRSKRLDAAKQQGEILVEATEQALSLTLAISSSSSSSTRPDADIFYRYQHRPTTAVMTDLCIALTELVHVHKDLGQPTVARALCSSVIQNYQLLQGVNFPDTRAAYAMEDMGELAELSVGSEGEAGARVDADAVYWLRWALDASCMLRGEGDAATLHIREKLRVLTEGTGQV